MDLQRILVARAKELGVRFIFGARVTGTDFETSAVFFEDGNGEKGDLVVADSGLWLWMQKCLSSRTILPQRTVDLAYRVV